MDPLVTMTESCSSDIRSKLLYYIQVWGVAFASKPELAYATQVYHSMKNQGFSFPELDKTETSTIMIEVQQVRKAYIVFFFVYSL